MNYTVVIDGLNYGINLDQLDYNISLSRTGGQGSIGPSAYEIAVANGFVGTEQEWLASLSWESAAAEAATIAARDAAIAARDAAENYSDLAEQDRQATVISATQAAASASSANSSQISADASQTSATASATSASTSAANALSSKNEAATSATNASLSAGQAATSATSAASSASSASTNATSASSSATSASASAASALLSKNSAAQSASESASNASSAGTSATNAATSAVTAEGYRDEALTYSQNAEASAASALSSKNSAATSASQAVNAANSAASSETNAINSATSASTSAATATTQASNAANSATQSATSATASHTSELASATSATQSATSASQSATSATSAANSASAAAQSAIDAANAATTAINSLVDGAPTTLDTLNELAAAIADDANYASTVSTALGNRLRIDTATQSLTTEQKINGRTNLGLGSAATNSTTDFATSAQGSIADSAVQPSDLATVATTGSYNDLTNKPTLGTAAATDSSAYATAAQGTTADTALQPSTIGVTVQGYDSATVKDASYVHTDNNYTTTEKSKLAGIAAGAEVNVNADWNATNGDAFIQNKPTLGTAAATNATDYATAAQGLLADSAVQPGANTSLTSLTGITGGVSTVDYIDFDTAAVVSGQVGRLRWNSIEGTLEFTMAGGNVTQQIGQELPVPVKNADAAGLVNGNVVYQAGSNGANTLVRNAQANAESTSSLVFGVMTESASGGASALCTTFGLVHDINTAALTEGQAVYLSPTIAGGLTSTKPVAPNHMVLVGYCIRSHASAGTIFVNIQNGYELNELHDVLITSAATNDFLVRNSSGLWVNQTPSTARTSMGLGSAATSSTSDFDAAGTAVALAIALG